LAGELQNDNQEEWLSNSVTIEAIWSKFIRLQKIRDESMADVAAEADAGAGTSLSVSINDKVLDPIDDELFQLAWLAADSKGATANDIVRKAMILTEYLEENSDDVMQALARSLVTDILSASQ